MILHTSQLAEEGKKRKNNSQTKEKILKEENHTYSNKKVEMEKKKTKNKTVIGVIGVLFTIFGIIGTIPVLQNRQYLWLIITAIAVVIGVILVAWSFSD